MTHVFLVDDTHDSQRPFSATFFEPLELYIELPNLLVQLGGLWLICRLIFVIRWPIEDRLNAFEELSLPEQNFRGMNLV
jgi:hypothetical protein